MADAPDTAWIVGASSGIGAALAACFADRGTPVVVSARRKDALQDLAATYPGLIHPVPFDVTDRGAIPGAVEETIRLLGGPPATTVLAAGAFSPARAHDMNADAFTAANAVNYLGTVNVLAALLPKLIDGGGGQVAIVASVAGYRGLPVAAAYGPTKAALINLAESLAPELAESGVRMRLVNPGFVATPMTAQNDFPMPFLMDPDKAAHRLHHALVHGKRFEITFPKRLTWILKLARILPYGLYFPMVRALTRRRLQESARKQS